MDRVNLIALVPTIIKELNYYGDSNGEELMVAGPTATLRAMTQQGPVRLTRVT